MKTFDFLPKLFKTEDTKPFLKGLVNIFGFDNHKSLSQLNNPATAEKKQPYRIYEGLSVAVFP